MRTTSAVFGLAAAIAVVCCQSAGAIPVRATAVKEAATAFSPVEQAQFAARRTRHGVVKCYRFLVIGPYRCHRYSRWF